VRESDERIDGGITGTSNLGLSLKANLKKRVGVGKCL
jgi:hypothetical protein